MTDTVYNRRPSPSSSSSLSSSLSTLLASWSWSWWLQLARFYHSIYVYASVFAITFGIQLYSYRQRIYTLSLSWERILGLYSIAALISLLVSLACCYAGWVARLLHTQYRKQQLAMQRMETQLQLQQLSLVQPETGQIGDHAN